MRILKRGLLLTLGLIAIMIVWLYVDAAWHSYTSYKRDVKGYMGLDIGASRKEAIYVFGYPDHVVGNKIFDPELDGEWSEVLDVTGNDPVNAIPKGKSINDYTEWSFAKDSYRVDVTFDTKTNTVASIACYVAEDRGYCPSIFDVYTGDDDEYVKRQLGEPDRSKYSGPSKTYQWDDLGIDVSLSERKVYMVEKRAAKGASTGWLIDRVLF